MGPRRKQRRVLVNDFGLENLNNGNGYFEGTADVRPILHSRNGTVTIRHVEALKTD